jgi:hypothetical protein
MRKRRFRIFLRTYQGDVPPPSHYDNTWPTRAQAEQEVGRRDKPAGGSYVVIEEAMVKNFGKQTKGVGSTKEAGPGGPDIKCRSNFDFGCPSVFEGGLLGFFFPFIPVGNRFLPPERTSRLT